MSLKHELQSIISGNGSVRNGKIIQTITDYLRGKKEAIQGAAKAKLVKEQETQVLIEFIDEKFGGNLDSPARISVRRNLMPFYT